MKKTQSENLRDLFDYLNNCPVELKALKFNYQWINNDFESATGRCSIEFIIDSNGEDLS